MSLLGDRVSKLTRVCDERFGSMPQLQQLLQENTKGVDRIGTRKTDTQGPEICKSWRKHIAPGNSYCVAGVIETKKARIGKIGGECLTYCSHLAFSYQIIIKRLDQ